MSGSGVIYGAIVVMWAAVLVPMWLRRHDDADEQFATAMRVLARRRGPGGDLPGGAYDAGELPEPLGGVPRGRTDVLVRRRRRLAALVAVTAVVAVTSMAGVTAWPLLLVSAAMLTVYVLHLRVQVLTSAGPGRRLVTSPQAYPPAAHATSRPVGEGGEPTSTRAAPPPAADTSAAGTAPHGSPWEPVRIPPPTYTTKPPAPSPARTIDLSRPGFWADGWRVAAQGPFADRGDGDAWDAEVEADHDDRVSRRSEPEELFDQEAPEHRWAVGD